jgi:iron complex outermembrane recepter protein
MAGNHALRGFRIVATVCILCGPSLALAQTTSAGSTASAETTSEGGALQEIVVTAQRREEKVQNVPIAVNVFNAASVAALGVSDTTSLNGVVPSLSISTNGPSNAFFIRGVGSPVAASNGEQSVAIYIDGVYMYSPEGNLFPIGSDVERIEVLKGPQGTLFGRNATAGVIQIITRDPTSEPSAEATIGYGNYQTFNASFWGSTGIAPNLSADLVVDIKHQGQGFGTDLYNGAQTYQLSYDMVKSKWLWTPADGTELRATVSFTRNYGTNSNTQIVPGKLGLNGQVANVPPYDTNANWPDTESDLTYFGSLQFDQTLDFMKIENIVSFRNIPKAFFQLDDDATAAPIINANVWHPSKTSTEELRFLAPAASKVDWVAGVYYINAFVGDTPLGLSGVGVLPTTPPDALNEYDTQKLWAIAGYAQATVPLVFDTNLTLGARYNNEHISTSGTYVQFIPPGGYAVDGIPESTSYNNVSWRGSIDHHWTPSIMSYVSANRSFKSGGYNLDSAPGTTLAPFLTEQVTAYEFGTKSDLFGRRLRVNLSPYYYDYKNIQVQSSIPAGTFIANGPSAHFAGVDADLSVAATESLTFSGGFNYVRGHYGSFPGAVGFTGNPFQGQIEFNGTGKETVYTPLWSSTLSADYVLPTAVGTFKLNANAKQSNSVYTAVLNRQTIPPYVVENDSISWSPAGDRYSVRFWILNAFDRVYFNNRLETGTGDWQVFAPPRTYGLSFTAKFGAEK